MLSIVNELNPSQGLIDSNPSLCINRQRIWELISRKMVTFYFCRAIAEIFQVYSRPCNRHDHFNVLMRRSTFYTFYCGNQIAITTEEQCCIISIFKGESQHIHRYINIRLLLLKRLIFILARSKAFSRNLFEFSKHDLNTSRSQCSQVNLVPLLFINIPRDQCREIIHTYELLCALGGKCRSQIPII